MKPLKSVKISETSLFNCWWTHGHHKQINFPIEFLLFFSSTCDMWRIFKCTRVQLLFGMLQIDSPVVASGKKMSNTAATQTRVLWHQHLLTIKENSYSLYQSNFHGWFIMKFIEWKGDTFLQLMKYWILKDKQIFNSEFTRLLVLTKLPSMHYRFSFSYCCHSKSSLNEHQLHHLMPIA